MGLFLCLNAFLLEKKQTVVLLITEHLKTIEIYEQNGRFKGLLL